MFRLINLDGRAALQRGDDHHDLATLSGDQALADPMVAIARFSELHALHAQTASRAPEGSIDPVLLGPPAPRPQKVFAIGLNYRKHAIESGSPLPPAPLTFTKFPSSLAGPVGEIEITGEQTDWEVELVVVVGTGGRRIAKADAWSHVAGLSVGQDISNRVVQRLGQPAQFSLGKSYDGYGPFGPALVSVDSFPDPDDVGISCSVDGEQMQGDRTSDLIFDVPELIAYLSGICTLVPGDVIFTGTPEGVGMGRGRFLQAGETLITEAEVIGSMTHRCVPRPD